MEKTLREMLQQIPGQKISVARYFEKRCRRVRGQSERHLKGTVRTKEVALPRQVAMYLAWKWINESLQALGISFWQNPFHHLARMQKH